ncbi:MAG TPA: zinc ABC transporter substrate-binding protein [Humisphaera sp.]
MKLPRIILPVLLAGALLLTGCVKGDTSAKGKLKVACTTTMVGDLVKRIGGDRVDVKVIMGPGVDPHTYKASPGDYAELNTAALVFYNGLHLEGKMVDVFEQQLKAKSTALASGVPEGKLLAWQAGETGAHDPHIWFDVSIWASAVPVVRDRLTAADPAGAETYKANAAAIEASLKALDAEVRQKLASVPKARRVLVTSHDAYGYFGKAYDVEVRGIQGISTETEAGVREMMVAAKFLQDRKIPAVFVESSVSPKTIESVVATCKGSGHDVKVGGELFSDAMGAPGQHPPYAVETYEGMVRYNVDTIVNALK